MRRYFMIPQGLAVIVSACTADTRPVAPVIPGAGLSLASAAGGSPRRERFIGNSFFTRSSDEVWRLGAATDSTFSVGIRRPGESRGILRGRWLVERQEIQSRAAALRNMPGVAGVTADSSLPRLLVEATDAGTIDALRQLGFVDYVEPRRFPNELVAYSSFGGCSTGHNGSFYYIGPTGDEIPTSYSLSMVDRAWAYSNGFGTLVGILDTGVNPANPQLTWQFTDGWSFGRRPLMQISTVGAAAIGNCSHGTYMAAVVAAPRDGRGTQGVAWKADLLAVTVESGVVNASGVDVTQGVLDATSLGAKVVAMALGVAVESSALNDAIDRGIVLSDVLFIGAAGTSPEWYRWHERYTVYPASNSGVMAVSAAEYTGIRNPESHAGPQLEVVAYSPTTTSSYDGLGHYNFSNSSNATAIVAGLAALVRSRFPTWSSDSVRRRIRNTAGASCGPATTFGPIINAEAAVGGLCVPHGAPIGTPTVTFERRAYGDNRSSATETYCVYPTGGSGAVTIRWGNGATTNCRTVTFSRGTYTQRVSVELHDTGASNPPLTVYLDVRVVDIDSTCRTCL